jgi:hypothetical protein
MIARVEKPKIIDENASGRIEDRDKGIYVLVPTRLKTSDDADNLNTLMQEFTAALGKKNPAPPRGRP